MERTFKTSDGVELSFEIEGEGKPLVLVHGWGSTRNFWRFIKPKLSREYQVITLDLRGHGRSSKNINVDFTLERISKDLIELSEFLGLDKFVYIGHSLGGVIGLYMGTIGFKRLGGIISITAPYELKSSFNGLSFKLIKFLLRKNRKLAALFLTPRLFSNGKNKSLLEFVRRESATVPVEVLIKVAEQNKNVDLLKQLNKIKVPVLVVSGGKDKIVKRKIIERMIREIQKVSHVEIKNGGHNLILEQPEELSEALISFLKDINFV